MSNYVFSSARQRIFDEEINSRTRKYSNKNIIYNNNNNYYYGHVNINNNNNNNNNYLTHMDEIPGSTHLSFQQYMIAGAAAGFMEHLCMYPVDTIKTRMQVHHKVGDPVYKSVWQAAKSIAKNEGVKRMYRGVVPVCLVAIPSHAIYFASYEKAKKILGANGTGYNPVAHALSGAIATIAHDLVTNPIDVVKQRLQIYNSSYPNVIECAKHVFKTEGISAFFLSYPTTLIMNVPFISVHFITYESIKHYLHPNGDHGHVSEMIAGGCAGGMGGLFSTPLDVIKTRIQTQEKATKSFHEGAIAMMKNIYKEEGLKGFTKGATARMFYFIPSAAICWSTYETVKRVLHIDHDDHEHD